MRTASPQSGNVLLYILIAIVMIGFLTVALRDNGGMNASVDKEGATARASQIIKYGGEVQKGIDTLLQNGVSENDIRFAYPGTSTFYGDITTTPQFQVFSGQGGQVVRRDPPAGSLSAGMTNTYGFVGNYSLPQVGSAKQDLVISLGNVNDQTCQAINAQLGISPTPSITCDSATTNAFNTGYTFNTSPKVIPASAFTTLPALQFCTYCSDESINRYIYTLLAR